MDELARVLLQVDAPDADPPLDEPELADLPRLILHFNRRDYGRLRQLIDCLNAAGDQEEHIA